ncbi:MAG: SLBB domain-containing protein, partial [Nitrospirae bacterium]|nr:SLBB domain-containing protein [Candidatus Troglogloeales bacterium]
MQLKEYESTTTLQNPEGREVEEGFVTRRRLPSDEQGASAFEAYVQGLASSGTSTKIRQFGYDLFDESPTTFAPANMLPVGPDYLLGPGDQILITLWGKINLDYERVIDSEGKIVLPEIGVLRLSGQTFAGAKTFLEKELSRYYQASEIKMNISMGSLRSMRIFVVGKALYPGSYTLSSFSTLVNALFASGGPSKLGTMRDIQVKRNGETITHFDLYDFLLKGDKTKDIRLMPEDVIFIPTIGPLVGIAGNVKVPAIYELKGETGLRNIIEMAGGVSATGYLRQVQVVRIIGNETRVVQDLNLERLTESANIPLQDGDLVKVFPITQTITNPIELKGNLLRPGTYEWKAGIKVRDIIKSSEDLLPDTFLEFALVERRVGPDYHKEYLSFDIGRLFMEGDEKENIPLSPYDTIVVFNKQELVGRDKVRITGAVNKPGENEFRPNMKLSDLLKLAGGFKRYAFTKEAELTRVTPTPEGPKIEKIVVALAKVMDGDPAYDIPLKEDDYLFVRAVP